MARNWFSVKALSAAKAELTIYDVIGSYGVSGRDFAQALDATPQADLDLYINSVGGSVTDALLMFNALMQSGKNVTVKIMGVAASAASYVAMAGTKVTMPENTFMMVHNPLNYVGLANAAEMRAMADDLDKIGASLLATYVTRSGKPEDEIKALLDAETLLTAAECLALGFCDEVTPAINAVAQFDTDRKDVPAQVQAIFAKAKPAPTGVPLAEQIATMAAAAGLADHAAVFALDPAVTSVEAAQQAIASAREITALCAVAKHADLAAALIKGRKTVAEASAELVATLAAEDEAAHVDTSQRSENKPKPVAQAGGPVAYWSARKPT